MGATSFRTFSKKRKAIVVFSLTLFAVFFHRVWQKRVDYPVLGEKNAETNASSGEKASAPPAEQSAIRQDSTQYYKSLFQNSPEPLQDSFVEDIRGQVNTVQTKSDIYFITHRYIDNGGDIYELYDFVESHPELAFMKEAEALYPETFSLIKNRSLPFQYSDFGMYAYLAYLEILDKHGYANIAMLATAANQYAKMAYYKESILKERAHGNALSEYPKYTKADINRDSVKAKKFIERSTEIVHQVVDGKTQSQEFHPLDIVYGAEQYASALRYGSALTASVATSEFASAAFSFVTRYAYQNTPELYLYVSLSNASTLLLVKSSTALELRNAVYPFFDIRNERNKQSGIVERIIRSRMVTVNTRFQDMDLYSRKNIIALARKVPEFKSWLMKNGWKQTDFK